MNVVAVKVGIIADTSKARIGNETGERLLWRCRDALPGLDFRRGKNAFGRDRCDCMVE